MNKKDQFRIPEKRSISFIERINNKSYFELIGIGIVIYAVVVLAISGLEFFNNPHCNFTTTGTTGISFWDILYFNFISILTIGYGDIAPKGWFRALTIIEAIIGLGIYTVTITIVIIKILLPKTHTVIFSKFAYYCTRDNTFMVIYLNTANQFLTNVSTSWYFKLNEDWKATVGVTVPFVTKSVQTYYLGYKPLDEFKANLHEFDCLRFAIKGDLGMANYSTHIQYNLDQILVIPDRSELTAYTGFYKVDEHIKDTAFTRLFHYKPEGAYFMSDLLRK